MKIMSIIESLTKLFQIRNIIIFNLILQCTLLFLSPLRKTSAKAAVTILLWASYTVASLSADYAVGLATHTSINTTASNSSSNRPIVALWASFILLQVVGPDTITAFSMEDTNSWFGNVRMFFTVGALLRAITFLLPMNRVAVAVFFVYIAGIFKYIERVLVLHFGNLTRFKTMTGPNIVLGSVSWLQPPHLPTPSVTSVVMDAFDFFQTFKAVFANLVISSHLSARSRDYFLMREAGDAFAVIETELNLAYDALYTKALLWPSLGRTVRFLPGALVLVAFFIWVSVDKREFNKIDVRVTYTLIISALVLDAASLLMTALSNWTIARVLLERSGEVTVRIMLIRKFLSLKKKFLPCRWSGSVSRYSLIMLSTSKSGTKVEKVLDWLKIKDVVYGFRNLSPTSFDENLRKFVFNELKYRSLKAEDLQVVRAMSSARGDWILRKYYHNNLLVSKFADTWLAKSIKFDRIVLLWHVATELCYYAYSSDTDDDEEKQRREFSKVISDYMAYLLVREQTMLSEVAGEAKATLEHTCDGVVKMLIARKADMKGKEKGRACRILVMEDPTQVLEGVDKAKDEISVLEGARSLSKELKGMEDQGIDMWEVTSKVWVELLCYSACKCKPSGHAAQLCKGGQLLTIVWLLMAHLGLSNRFEDLN